MYFLLQGDLGAIDDKYDVAVSTACGPLDNIVCDTINTAQRCVEYLKKSNLASQHLLDLINKPTSEMFLEERSTRMFLIPTV